MVADDMRDFCRAMLCISAAYAIMRCLCVRLCVCLCAVTFVNSVETTKKHIFKCFTPSSSQAILVFWYQTVWQYSDGNPLTGASNTCGVGRNRDSEPISGFTAYVVKRSSGKCSKLGCRTNHAEYITLVAGDRPSLLMAARQETTTKCMTRSLNVTPKTTLRSSG